MKKIEAKIVADSVSSQGHRITSMLLTYPRIIHGEVMTHRLFSRNSASSRAIPFEKMVKMVEEDPFVPIAWQRDHKGMQGSEYVKTTDGLYVVERYWLEARDRAVKAARGLASCDITKQLCNRILEPFMWHTTLVTATELDNFFELRCPRYEFDDRTFKSTKDVCNYIGNCVLVKMDGLTAILTSHDTTYQTTNTSQAEIHIQALAESMWDAMNESTPRKLKAGEFHIPFGDKIDLSSFDKPAGAPGSGKIATINIPENYVRIATARCARLSYMTHEGEIDYEKDIRLHDQLLNDGHMSPFEHCARAMSDAEYYSSIKTSKYPVLIPKNQKDFESNGGVVNCELYPQHEEYGQHIDKSMYGWCNNFRGWIQYRYLVEKNKL